MPAEFLFHHDLLAHAYLPYPIFDMVFEIEAADDPAGNDGHCKASGHIKSGDLPAQQAVKQHHRYLVDHGGGDEKGKGDAQRHTGLDKADKKRHGRTGTERSDNA